MTRTHSTYNYLIFGAGRQGTAAAYDLARFGSAGRITLADAALLAAQQAAGRVNRLVGSEIAFPMELDVADSTEVGKALDGADAALSAVPYYYNLAITRAAIAAGSHLCDMGGNTHIVREQMALDEAARQAGISVVPDCGMGPGLINTMGAYAIDLLDEPEEVHIYDAGLPQNPRPPWNYELSFHINGLTNEMDGKAVFLRGGEIVQVETLSEPEMIDFPPLGTLEADVTSGGTSTAPWTFKGKLRRYENKVLRYPGHYEWLRAYKSLGLFSEQPVHVGDQEIIPRQVYHALLEPKIAAGETRDVCVIRAVGVGKKGGRPVKVIIDLIDYYDEKTGFTSMERLTGWHCSIMMIFQARRQISAGCIPVEIAVEPTVFMENIKKRGIRFEVRWEELTA